MLKRTIREDFVVIDSQFPQKSPAGFRNTEISEYFRRLKNVSSYAMYPMMPDTDAWFTHGYGMSEQEFADNKRSYLQRNVHNTGRIHYLSDRKRYKFTLAYSYFLAETYVLLPFFEKHKIPFVFALYPGGAFGLDYDESDKMLKKIFTSKYFRHVIVNQQITKDYLLKKKLTPEKKITYIFGGFVQYREDDIKKKLYYKKDKSTFDICFVAGKYSPGGHDKGYDLFIETARELCKTTQDIFFHVVGGFGPRDADISDIKSRIKFYGYKQPSFLLNFYSKMDIFLSPNRPYKLYKGSFDGFPLGGDALYCGVALFASDELHQSRKQFVPNKDIVIVPLNSKRIANKINYYYNNLDKLYELARRGQKKGQELLDVNLQVESRIDVFQKYVELEIKE